MITESDARAEVLITLLGLVPHPEGGRYAQIFRSARRVLAPQGERDGLTTIYFLLRADEHSRWHQVQSDEAWHWVEGAPLELLLWPRGQPSLQRLRLGPCDAAGTRPVAVAPAGVWQAARTTGAYTLVACDVGPGFDFADFTLAERPEIRAAIAELGAEASALL